jgi:hypothetical protein
VYYLVDETTFPSESKELHGQWVGVSKNVGHFMTYKILTDDTHRIIHLLDYSPFQHSFGG